MNHRLLFASRLLAMTLAFMAVTGASVWAQSVIAVDLYGVRAVDADKIRAVVDVPVGEPFTASSSKIIKAVEAIDGVEKASVWPISMGDTMAIFIGVQEAGAKSTATRPRPTEDIRLPQEVVETYDRVMSLLGEALRAGQGMEDTEDGHSLSHYPPMREQEMLFLDYSEEYFLELVDVLHQSKYDHERAVAACVLAYAEDKSEVIPDLQIASSDADSTVRNNATRALSLLVDYARQNPDLDLEVDPEPFLTLIESFEWTDRNKGSAVIAAISKYREPAFLETLRQRSLPYLFEMAEWKSLGHASFSIGTLARIAGIPEEEIGQRIGLVFSEEGAQEAFLKELRERLEYPTARAE